MGSSLLVGCGVVPCPITGEQDTVPLLLGWSSASLLGEQNESCWHLSGRCQRGISMGLWRNPVPLRKGASQPGQVLCSFPWRWESVPLLLGPPPAQQAPLHQPQARVSGSDSLRTGVPALKLSSPSCSALLWLPCSHQLLLPCHCHLPLELSPLLAVRNTAARPRGPARDYISQQPLRHRLVSRLQVPACPRQSLGEGPPVPAPGNPLGPGIEWAPIPTTFS